MPGFRASEEEAAQFLRGRAVFLHHTSHDGFAALDVRTWRAKDQAFAHGWMRRKKLLDVFRRNLAPRDVDDITRPPAKIDKSIIDLCEIARGVDGIR